MYLRHGELDVAGLNLMQDATVEDHKAIFCKKVGSVLQGWNKKELSDFCRIKDNDAGRQIVSTMISKCINEQFAWPSMLGSVNELLAGFWKGRHNAAVDLGLAPLRMVHVSSGKATLGVDMRWLLICAAMAGVSPSQTRRFGVVRHIAQRIHLACIPSRMMTAPRLFIGLPHVDVRRGLEPLEVLLPRRGGSRRLLMRHARNVGMDAPIVPTHMVEDLGPAGPRLQLTRILMGAGWTADSFPTDSAHSPLPHGMWTPVMMMMASDSVSQDSTTTTTNISNPTVEYAAIKTNNDGIFWLSRRDPVTGAVLSPLDITAPFSAQSQGEVFLYGRVVAPVRPLCVFDRPGVLLRMQEEDLINMDSDRLLVYAAVLLDVRVAKSLMSCPSQMINGQAASGLEMESDRLRAAVDSIIQASSETSAEDSVVRYSSFKAY